MPAKDNHENQTLCEEEYLRTELISEIRREYINGQIYAKTGESFNHNLISGNVGSKFSDHLKGTPCATFILAMMLRLGKDYVYPDVMVDCSPMEGEDFIAKSPVILVEVLSKTTRRIDSTIKLKNYINLPSLQEYVLIEQEYTSVQILRRRKHWQSEYFFLDDSASFESIDLVLPVAEIYERVDNAELREILHN